MSRVRFNARAATLDAVSVGMTTVSVGRSDSLTPVLWSWVVKTKILEGKQ
jgi:hypothetical protein